MGAAAMMHPVDKEDVNHHVWPTYSPRVVFNSLTP